MLFSSPFLPGVFLIYRKIPAFNGRAENFGIFPRQPMLFYPCLEKPNYYIDFFESDVMSGSRRLTSQ